MFTLFFPQLEITWLMASHKWSLRYTCSTNDCGNKVSRLRDLSSVCVCVCFFFWRPQAFLMNPGSSSARRPFSAEPGIGTLLVLCSQHTKLSNLGIACQQNKKKRPVGQIGVSLWPLIHCKRKFHGQKCQLETHQVSHTCMVALRPQRHSQ